MKLSSLLIGLMLCCIVATAQQKMHMIDTENLREEQLEKLEEIAATDGWVHIRHEGQNIVSNFSNPDYMLRVQFNCVNEQPPGFLIEFSNHYRDGDYGGIDYLSASDNKTVHFFIDGKDFDNPFLAPDKERFAVFVAALKQGKVLTVDVAKERKIDFKLANGQYLDLPVACYARREQDTSVYDEEEEPVAVQVEEYE